MIFEFKGKCLIKAGLALCCLLSGVASGATHPGNNTLTLPPSLPAGDYQLEDAFPGKRFSSPVGIVQMPGHLDRVFIVEKTGRIRMMTFGETEISDDVFLNISSRVRSGSGNGEQGLLGLAFHPRFQENGLFFVFYTANESGAPNRLSRFQVDPEQPFIGLPDSETILINQHDEASNHNGGDLHFGPDGYLYVALGDEGAANDSFRNSQQIDKDFFAAILRIDVDELLGNLPPNPHPSVIGHYLVPKDNPFVDADSFLGSPVEKAKVRTEFWAVGLRNPWRMSFDSVTGRLYVGDVGQGRLEEVDIIVKGGNYGWYFKEGTMNGPGIRRAPEGFEDIPPLLEYEHGSRLNQGNSITGGVVYRGNLHSELYGAYIFADFVSGHIWALHHDGERVIQWWNLARDSGIAGFGIDPRQGDILMADHGSGRILRLVAAETTPEVPLPATLADTGAFRDLETLEPHEGIIPYEINTAFWSDHAIKSRWFSVPDPEGLVGWSAQGLWSFPAGMVWIKHFDLELVRGDPSSKRRLETRFLVKSERGIYGLTYRWDEEQENAHLVDASGKEETFVIQDGDQTIEQVWRYPSRSECLACHTATSGQALAFHTAQLNREVLRDGASVSQLEWLDKMGYFDGQPGDIEKLPAMVAVSDASASLTHRVKSYLSANCSQCHRPGGEALGYWDARYETPLLEAGLLNGILVRDEGAVEQRVIVPGDLDRSEMYQRISKASSKRMPPVGSHVLDDAGIELMQAWITSLNSSRTYEQWQSTAFGDQAAGRTEPDEDADGDGWTNGAEFFLGTDPTIRFDEWRMRINREDFTLSFPKIHHPEVSFQLRYASSIQPDAEWQAVDPLEIVDDGRGLWKWEVGLPGTGPRYFRSEISFPPLSDGREESQ